jgi:2-oxoglutarate dehydrogenase E1 component
MTSYSDLKSSSAFEGNNASYLESLYEQYQHNPTSVSAEWQKYFANYLANGGQEPNHSNIREHFLALAKNKKVAYELVSNDQQVKVFDLIQAYRQFGHLQAKIDPLNLMQRPALNCLNLDYYGLSLQDSAQYNTNQLANNNQASIKTIVDQCQKIYCSAIGFEYEHIDNPDEIKWLRSRIEQFADWQLPPAEKINLLQQLTATEGLEKALGAKYVGVTRFSVEGGDSQIPLLNHIIQHSTTVGVKEVVIGMAHRGRLNVLANVLGMPTQEILSQFDGTFQYAKNRSDDVKYHYGYSANLGTTNGPVHAVLAFNPSHLEIIAPVCQGSVRAKQDRRNDVSHDHVLNIAFHGDSAFAGQGVVMETFSLSQTRGFTVGGTMHIVVNNQVGFTTSNPQDTRSSTYCTDIAKMINAPIFHVNSDQPEAVLFVAQLALDYRHQFHKDVVIDLVCYRRFGHNEGDEPSATQPLMYQTIKQLPTVRKLYSEQLLQQNIVTETQINEMVQQYRAAIDNNMVLISQVPNPDYQGYEVDWTKYIDAAWTDSVNTALSQKEFNAIASNITATPEDFQLQPQVARTLNNRAIAYKGEAPLIWGDAEMLAYGSLAYKGHRVRLVGQDSGRGTFAHRHAIVYDQNTGAPYSTLNHLSPDQAPFHVVDSVLSENAVMAFEFGYASTAPNALVLWEAQYGDFVNGAQVVIDQFLSASEQKWNRYCGLVLLLPHGYEGAGPEHSSARPERFLQLCAQENMQVCVPSTPAQLFHLLRRQVLRPYRKPLIILTPKALLRKATSNLNEILSGGFQLIIPAKNDAPEKINRLILCSGKIYYDLEEKRIALKQEDTALVRIEQLYPFPTDALTAELLRYKKTKNIIWCQEEPKNQGAWREIRHSLEACLQPGQNLSYAGRPESASTAAGYKKLHEKEQLQVIEEALSKKF